VQIVEDIVSIRSSIVFIASSDLVVTAVSRISKALRQSAVEVSPQSPQTFRPSLRRFILRDLVLETYPFADAASSSDNCGYFLPLVLLVPLLKFYLVGHG
jgi:hypothetical protein